MPGVKFGQKEYVLTILKVTEDEVHRSPGLRHNYPWFDNPELAAERLSRQVRLNKNEKELLDITKGIFRQHVLENAASYKTHLPPPTVSSSPLARSGLPLSSPTTLACLN